MDDLISIIVPVYNAERFLNKCIFSITNQTYTNLEIILVDDGSTDKSGAICDEWKKKDQRIKVIHQKNAGVSAARNKALKNVRGKYIGFVDSDDSIETNMYEKMINQFENNTDIVVCNHYRNTETHKIVGAEDYPKSDWKEELISFKRITGYLWDKLYRAELVLGESFKTNIFFMEDLIFNYSIGNKKINYKYICEPLYNYYQHKNSITHSEYLYNESMLDATIEMVNLIEKDNKEWTVNWKILYEKKYNLYKYSFKKKGIPLKKAKLYRKYAKVFELKYDTLKKLSIREIFEYTFITRFSYFYYVIKKMKTKLEDN